MMTFRIAAGIRSHFVSRLPEWLLAGQMGMFGWQLARTGNTFASSTTYSVMAHIQLPIPVMAEIQWGAAALAISLFWLFSLILNGSFRWFARWSRWVRSVSAFMAAGFWSAAAISMYEANPISTGVTNNAGFAVMAFIVSLITARDLGAAEKRAKHAASGQ